MKETSSKSVTKRNKVVKTRVTSKKPTRPSSTAKKAVKAGVTSKKPMRPYSTAKKAVKAGVTSKKPTRPSSTAKKAVKGGVTSKKPTRPSTKKTMKPTHSTSNISNEGGGFWRPKGANKHDRHDSRVTRALRGERVKLSAFKRNMPGFKDAKAKQAIYEKAYNTGISLDVYNRAQQQQNPNHTPVDISSVVPEGLYRGQPQIR